MTENEERRQLTRTESHILIRYAVEAALEATLRLGNGLEIPVFVTEYTEQRAGRASYRFIVESNGAPWTIARERSGPLPNRDLGDEQPTRARGGGS